MFWWSAPQVPCAINAANGKGAFFLEESKNGFVISDHSDHAVSKEHSGSGFVGSFDALIWDHKSVLGFYQKNAP